MININSVKKERNLSGIFPTQPLSTLQHSCAVQTIFPTETLELAQILALAQPQNMHVLISPHVLGQQRKRTLVPYLATSFQLCKSTVPQAVYDG